MNKNIIKVIDIDVITSFIVVLSSLLLSSILTPLLYCHNKVEKGVNGHTLPYLIANMDYNHL